MKIFVFNEFVYLDSETTKNVLIASTYIHLKCNKFAKYTSDLPTVCPRILFSGPAGTMPSFCCHIANFLFSITFLPFGFTLEIIILIYFPIGSEIFQETLTKALTKHFGARLLIIDSLLLPGVSFFNNFI